MTTIVKGNDAHDAMTRMLLMFDETRKECGPTALTVARHGDIAVNIPEMTRSPMDYMFAALTFIGNNRKSIMGMREQLSAKIHAAVDGHSHGQDHFVIKADDCHFAGQTNGEFITASFYVHSQLFMHSGFPDLAEKLTSYGLLHGFLAESMHMRAGAASYFFEGITAGDIPPVLFADGETYYAKRSPYDGGRAPSPVLTPDLALKVLSAGHAPSAFLEDVAMLVNERVSIGLRHRWVRRVAVPIVMSYRHLRTGRVDKNAARGAVKILRQCEDVALRTSCRDWIVKRYDLTGEDIREGEIHS